MRQFRSMGPGGPALPAPGSSVRFVVSALLAGVVLGLGATWLSAAPAFDTARWRAAFRRPLEILAPAANPVTPEKVALGARLFGEKHLSGNGEIACATCHQAELSFSDGIARRKGLDGKLLVRRTPPLWNAAWGLTQFWDGRAPSLEAQVAGPLENPVEMAGNLDRAVAWLRGDAGYRQSFAAAFPDRKQPVTRETLAQAIATYERMLVSPPTRFDLWVAGDEAALDATEMQGFALFVGKAQCVACHKGWRFTDDAFHDIGLPLATKPDRGRGAILRIGKADYSFKTPSLRERLWTAPYMHDGAFASLEAVVRHYAEGRAALRPSLSADLDRKIWLDPEEQAAIVAFLATISSDNPPRPLALPARTQTIGGAGPFVLASKIAQKNRRFMPGAVTIHVGEALTIVNDDTRTHTVRLDDPSFHGNSEAQEPGDTVEIAFPKTGLFTVTCGIHPEMRLDVRVTR
jgi:cytochrome c peroxidase